jgi:hypothetical protein
VWRRDLDLPSNVEIVARDLVQEWNIAWLLHYRDDRKRIKKQAEFRMSILLRLLVVVVRWRGSLNLPVPRPVYCTAYTVILDAARHTQLQALVWHNALILFSFEQYVTTYAGHLHGQGEYVMLGIENSRRSIVLATTSRCRGSSAAFQNIGRRKSTASMASTAQRI